MSEAPDHNALIRSAARRTLAPIGLRQRGRSRTWLDDHGWWLIVVEFQPSSWARGTYLNVGVIWLWRAMDHVAFEFGGRIGEFVDVEKASDIAGEIDHVARRAAFEVQRLRHALTTPIQAARELLSKPAAGGWDFLYAATAAAVAGDPDMSFGALARIEPPGLGAPEWQQRFWEEVQLLRSKVSNPAALEARLNEAVQRSRASLKLPEWKGSLPFAPRPAA